MSVEAARLRVRERALEALRGLREDWTAQGVASASLFGSAARGEAHAGSDVDVAIRLSAQARLTGWDVLTLRDQLRDRIGPPVELVLEPNRNAELQAAIDRDRLVAY